MRIRFAIFALAVGLLGGAAVPVFAARGGTGKSLVCHRGHTINISISAVPAHLRHGDTLGPCGAAATQTPTPAATSAATPTNTLEPTATGTPEPTATDTPEPEATATDTPEATPTEVVVTGSGGRRGNGQ